MNIQIEDMRPTGKRKKLYEIKGHYHCSIVGTCLSMKELDKLKRKAGVKIPSNATEHEIHGIFVYLAGENELPAKLMTKLLDKKYAKEVKEFSRLKTDKEVEEKWRQELDNGNIPGPYWALMSHSFSSFKTLSDAFGEVHMLSHLIGRSNRSDIKRVKRLEEENDRITNKLRLSKKVYSTRFKEINKKLEIERKKSAQLFHLIDEAESEIIDLKNQVNNRIDEDTDNSKIDELIKSIEFLKNENFVLNQKNIELENELKETKDRNENLELIFSYNEAQEEPEINVSEKCIGCTSKNCPGPDLCGKKILYVGGRKNTLPKYKEIVEQHGGKFIYHDGGMESSKKTIDNIVSSADMVFCPVDCTSHDACLRLKKICKKTDKSFVPLKSSGASSFMRYIETLN